MCCINSVYGKFLQRIHRLCQIPDCYSLVDTTRQRLLPCLSLIVLFMSSGCVFLPQNFRYSGPVARTPAIEDYYAKGTYGEFYEEVLQKTSSYTIKRITISTDRGDIVVDYFQQGKENKDLVFVFPILGGNNIFENYFAAHLARHGYDAAIVHRDGKFKNPDYFLQIEDIFRDNVIRDRIAIDFFEKEYGKQEFGSFGISRGAINAAITAGVDKRLKHNVLALGGADLRNIFRYTDQPGVAKYKKKVLEKYNMTEADFYAYIEKTVRTDPDRLAKYIDARDTLMFLSVFDETVPFKYGLKLRRRIGYPRTIFLFSGHYTSAAYTQLVRIALPVEDFCLLPFDFVEEETVSFYNRSFRDKPGQLSHYFFSILQAPVQAIGSLVFRAWDKPKTEVDEIPLLAGAPRPSHPPDSKSALVHPVQAVLPEISSPEQQVSFVGIPLQEGTEVGTAVITVDSSGTTMGAGN